MYFNLSDPAWKRILPISCLLLLTSSAPCPGQEPSENSTAAGPAPTLEPEPQKPFFKRLFSLQAVGASVPGAMMQQLRNWPEEWGGKRTGFEKRVGSLYGQFATGMLIEDGVQAIDHEDTRYRRAGTGNFLARTGHVIADTMTARTPTGARTPAWSLAASEYGSWAIATLWSPHRYRTAPSIAWWGSVGLAEAPLANFLREFWPDVRGVFRGKR